MSGLWDRSRLGCSLLFRVSLAFLACLAVHFFLGFAFAEAGVTQDALRFSRNADRPSCASGVARISAMRCAVISIKVSSMRLPATCGIIFLIATTALGPPE